MFDLKTPLADRGVTLNEATIGARFSLRLGGDAIALAKMALGFALPTKPSSVTTSGTLSALWLGPDEWLVLDESAVSDLPARVEKALNGVPHALVGITHRQIGMRLEGRLAARILSSGCPLDLDLSAFPVGMATRTLFHKAEIVLWRRGAEAFHIEAWRSFVPYIEGHLAEAAKGARGL